MIEEVSGMELSAGIIIQESCNCENMEAEKLCRVGV